MFYSYLTTELSRVKYFGVNSKWRDMCLCLVSLHDFSKVWVGDASFWPVISTNIIIWDFLLSFWLIDYSVKAYTKMRYVTFCDKVQLRAYIILFKHFINSFHFMIYCFQIFKIYTTKNFHKLIPYLNDYLNLGK